MERTSVIVIFLATTVYAGYTPIYRELIEPATEVCQPYLGASEADAETVYMHRMLTTQTHACLQYCVYAQAGVMNGTKFAPLENLLAIYNKVYENDPEFQAVAEPVVEGCVNEGNSLNTEDTCLLAKFMQECLNIKGLQLTTHIQVSA